MEIRIRYFSHILADTRKQQQQQYQMRAKKKKKKHSSKVKGSKYRIIYYIMKMKRYLRLFFISRLQFSYKNNGKEQQNRKTVLNIKRCDC